LALVRKEQQLLKAKALDRQNRPVIDLACYLIAVLIRIDTKKNFLGLCPF
jgi:hypothetical protein